MGNRQYFGCRVQQRVDSETVVFFVFYARVKDIREWSGIKRAVEHAEGTQRVLRPSRSRAVARFLARGSINTIPNNILLAFNPGTTQFISVKQQIADCIPEVDIDNDCDDQLDWGVLSFSFALDTPEHLRPALIVDGQHRLDGMSHFEKEDIPVLIVCLLDAPPQEQAFQFIVINSKAVRVSTDNAKTIVADFTKEEETVLGERLMEAGINYADNSAILKDINDLENSPFRRMLDWEYNREGKARQREIGGTLISLTAIEVALRYIKGQFDFLNLDEDEDTLVEIFCAIWRAARSKFNGLWGKDNTFMTKVSITALNEFIVDRLKSSYVDNKVDISVAEEVESKTAEYLVPVEEAFWTLDWSVKVQDNANIRNRIKEDLWTMTTNATRGAAWNRGLRLPISD